MSQWWSRPGILLVVILLVTTMLYASSIHNPFILDDFHTIVENPHIRILNNIPAFFTSPDYFSVFGQRHQHYRPVLLITFALNYHWSGVNPEGYRIMNLAFHLFGIGMVYLLVRRLFASTRIALLSAVIFALHPFQSEVVNYVSARSSSMATVFYILTVYLFIIFRDHQECGKGALRVSGLYLAFLLSFCLALLSKEISLTLLLVLGLVDLLIIRLKGKRDLLTKSIAYLPFVGVAGFFSFRIDLLNSLINVPYAPLTTQAQVLFMTPKLLLFPIGLAADHPISQFNSFFQPAVIMAFVFLGGLFILGFRLAVSPSQTQRNLSFLIFWFFIASLPTTLFPLNQAFVEHRGYLPSVGLIPLMAMGIERSWRLIRGYHWYRLKEVFTVIGLAVLIIYGNLVIKRNQVWYEPIHLWGDTLAKHPESKLGQLFLANAFQQNGEDDRALELFQKIISDDPECRHHFSCSKAHLAVGDYLERTGKLEDAIKEYEVTLRLVPESYWIRYRLGVVYQKQGNLMLASQYYQEALKRHPTAHDVHYALGTVYETQKQYDLAQDHYEAALNRIPDLHRARTRLASVLARKGLFEEATREYETVLANEANNGLAHRGLGYIYETQGNLDQAIRHYESAIAAGSGDPGFLYHLGSLYLEIGNKELAKHQWENAIANAPDFLEARLNLARLLQQDGQRDQAISQYRQLKAVVPADKRYQALSKQVEAELHRLERER